MLDFFEILFKCLITQGKCGNEYFFQYCESFKEFQLQLFVFLSCTGYPEFITLVGP